MSSFSGCFTAREMFAAEFTAEYRSAMRPSPAVQAARVSHSLFLLAIGRELVVEHPFRPEADLRLLNPFPDQGGLRAVSLPGLLD